jgi:microcystin-dependent protein
MPDTNTTNLLLIDQTTGGNYNSWGDIADANWHKLDAKAGNITALALTNSNVTLTATEERVNAIHLTGTLTGNVDILFTGKGGRWIVKNSCSGNYTVTLKISGQTGCTISRGTTIQVYFNGTDIAYGGPIGPSVGFYQDYAGATSPTGWVRANGRTIGSAASSATERANADCAELYALLWDTYSNTLLVIQDSAGTPTTRGASAAADFAANKRMPLPDIRSRAKVGVDDMGNSAAGRLGTVITTPTVLGSAGGTETHALATGELATHAHTIAHDHTFSDTSTTESATHTHTSVGTTDAGGDHTHDIVVSTRRMRDDGSNDFPFSGSGGGAADDTGVGASGTHTHTFTVISGNASATHTHDVSGTTSASSAANSGNAGSGTAHTNLQPSYLVTVLIKL